MTSSGPRPADLRRDPPAAVVSRTLVVGSYLVALAIAGRPGWLAALVAACLVAVWAAPLALSPRDAHLAARPAAPGPSGMPPER